MVAISSKEKCSMVSKSVSSKLVVPNTLVD